MRNSTSRQKGRTLSGGIRNEYEKTEKKPDLVKKFFPIFFG
jgi:hypothetical protein